MCVNNPESNNLFDDIWKVESIQELIITKQPQNIKLFDDKIGILPSLKVKYGLNDIIATEDCTKSLPPEKTKEQLMEETFIELMNQGLRTYFESRR